MGIYNRKDFYYNKAKKEGYRSRAAYKLLELNKRYSLIKAGDYVADLGCAPGGFLQVAEDLVGENGIVIGVDLMEVAPLGKNVFIIQGDFTKADVKREILKLSNNKRFDVILSDMAPKTTGITFRDTYLSLELAQEAFNSSKELLKKGGNILIKVFESDGLRLLIDNMKKSFDPVFLNRPQSSRKGSREIYIIGKGYH